MARTLELREDCQTFSIVTTKKMRAQLQVVSVLMGRKGAVGPIVREILERFIEKFAEENRREYDLMISSLMEEQADQDATGAPVAGAEQSGMSNF